MATDVTDFEICRTLIYQCIDSSRAKRNVLYATGEIDKAEYINIGKTIEERLHRLAKDLTLQISKGIIKDFAQHTTQIQTVTTKVQQVSKKIQGINKSLAFFTNIVNFFGSILSVASTGLAGIPTLLTNFEKILV